MRSTRFGVVLLAAVSFVSGAQEPRRLIQPDSVPIDLATALIGAGGLGGDMQILIGDLPGWVSERVPPPENATVLGSAFVGSSVVGILRVPDAPEAVIAALKQELPKRGWKAPPPPPAPTVYGGGFRPAASANFNTTGTNATRLTLCADKQILIVSAVRRRSIATNVTIRVSPDATYSVCNPPPRPNPMENRPSLPTLFNPAEAGDGRTFYSACNVMWNGVNGSGTSLMAKMTPVGILEHYAKQLQDSGWAPVSGAGTVGRVWTRPDSTGTPVELFLSVTTEARDTTCHQVSMTARTAKTP